MTASAAPAIGTRVSQDLVLDAASIRAGATLLGDANLLHHDADYAARSRYGGLIASGAHTAGLLGALVTHGFAAPSPDAPGGVGVDYQIRFAAPVRAGQALRLSWEVLAHEPRRSGTLVRLQGGIADAETGALLLEGTMTVLYFGDGPRSL